MNSTGRLSVVALCIFGWIPLSVLAQAVADKPVLKVGDKWEFRQSVHSEPGEDSNSVWSRRIVQLLPNDQMKVAGDKDQLILHDTSWNTIDPKGAEYSLAPFKFPMTVGAAWSYSARAGQTGESERRGNYKVAAFEPVTVPAGTFECFRVEGEWETTGTYYRGRGTDSYWYCPKLNFIAKRRSESTAQGRTGGRTKETRLSELTKFTPSE